MIKEVIIVDMIYTEIFSIRSSQSLIYIWALEFNGVYVKLFHH